MEHDLVDQSQRDLEVEAEGPNDAHEHDRHEQLPALAHIREALAQVAPMASQPGSGEQLG